MTDAERAREVMDVDRELVDEIDALLRAGDWSGAECAAGAARIVAIAQAYATGRAEGIALAADMASLAGLDAADVEEIRARITTTGGGAALQPASSEEEGKP